MTRYRVATEGRLDLAVAARLLAEYGAEAEPAGPNIGRDKLLQRLHGYNEAARRERWFVLVDLDRDECGPSLLKQHLPSPTSGMLMRVAVREVESWLLADHGIARHLRVARQHLPSDTDALQSPKRRLVDLVRSHCKTRSVRAAVLPRTSDATVGPEYTDFMIDFVQTAWIPRRAAEGSGSLNRCLAALQRRQ